MKKRTISFFATLALAPALAIGTAQAQTVLFEADFESGTAPNGGGESGAFYGGGNPFFQSDGSVTVDNSGTGNGSTSALTAELLGATSGADFTFFGVFVQDDEGVNGTGSGLDISSADEVNFDLRLGQASSHAEYQVKLEDVDPTGAGDFENTTVALTPNPSDTGWESYSIPLSSFTSGSQPVDPTKFSQITIEAANPPTGGGTFDFSLLVDNVQIVDTATSVNDWTMYE